MKRICAIVSREEEIVYCVASYMNSNQVNNGTRASYGYRESVFPESPTVLRLFTEVIARHNWPNLHVKSGQEALSLDDDGERAGKLRSKRRIASV